MSRVPGDGRQVTGMIGLGLLGSAIARRLLERGLEVIGLDIDPGRAPELGMETTDSPAQLAERVERVVLCLPDSDAVEEVCGGSAGLLAAAASRLELVIDCTTGDPDRSEALAGRMGGAGIAFVEAEVSGSSELMLSGEAALLVGAEPGSLEAAAELLDALSPLVFHLGPVGAGAKMKLVSNLVVGLNRLVLAEAVYLARRTLRTIRQNLFLAFVYNSIAIPVAAFGLLGPYGPLFAAAAMGLSDVSVIGNALRLRAKLRRD